MKFLRDLLDNIKPHVEPGGKFEKLHTTFDALETFLFVPNTVTKNGTHIRDGIDLKRTMDHVIKALIPCLLFGIWNVGHQHYLGIEGGTGGVNWGDKFFWEFVYGLQVVLPIVVTSYISGLAVEFVFTSIKGEQINEGYLVTGMLIPLIMPPTVPLWMVAVATIFAVIIGKEAFGGTGMNILNVALTARVFLFFAYPKQMSGDKVWVSQDAVPLQSLNGDLNGANIVDGYTGATPLGQAVESGSSLVSTVGDPIGFSELFYGFIPGSIGETSTVACLIGAAILLITGIGSWRVMISVLLGGITMGFLFNLIGGNPFMETPWYYHIVMGGFMFGLVYMATDPVTAAQTNTGKYIYGFFIGLLAVLIRVVNPAYPEGMMLAILLMNVFAPLIDHYVIDANKQSRLKRAVLVSNQEIKE